MHLSVPKDLIWYAIILLETANWVPLSVGVRTYPGVSLSRTTQGVQLETLHPCNSVEQYTGGFVLELEAELNAGLEPEVALVVVATRKVIAKAGQ
jgi:hypothetical protein